MFQKFCDVLSASPFEDVHGHDAVAVAVSGGPDSMALAHLLSNWAQKNQSPNIHVLSVDHGLRAEAKEETDFVKNIVSKWPNVIHQTLTWNGEKPDSRVQEEARQARYDLFEQYCKAHSIQHLFLAHHGDDQIETLLFRLSKGSGLDGLCAMRSAQKRGDIKLMRPLLEFSKDDLVQYCNDQKIDFIQDPSNKSDDFARVRLRKMIASLEEEGFSMKRALTTIQRLQKAKEALDGIVEKTYQNSISIKETGRIELKFKVLAGNEFDVVYRVIKKAILHLHSDHDYGPRTEKLETLVSDFLRASEFKKRCLGGIMFSLSKDKERLVLEKEGL